MSESFQPRYGVTKTISASTTPSAAVKLVDATGESQIEIYNNLTTLIFFKLGDAGVTATTTDGFVAPKGIARFARDRTETHISIRSASGTGSVYVAQG